MTRKDFELIAKVIAESWHDSAETRRGIAQNMADALAGTNPRFDRDIFLKKCGVN